MTDAPWRLYDDTICLLGEGALWHPLRGELFWFDILGRMLHAKGRRWSLPGLASAAGWIDRDTLLVAHDKHLSRFDLATGAMEAVAAVEEDNPVTRFNDGRADPWGGFWIGTMGIGTEKDAGSIWRYFRGEVRRLKAPVTIPNAICFHPDGTHAAYADTAAQLVWRQPLGDKDGFPVGEPAPSLDLRGTDLYPDGAVFDAAGTIWVALWGSGRVAGYRSDGSAAGAFACPARQTTCPAFGGEGLATLFCTSAAVAIPQEEVARAPEQGRTFAWDAGRKGMPEPRVIL